MHNREKQGLETSKARDWLILHWFLRKTCLDFLARAAGHPAPFPLFWGVPLHAPLNSPPLGLSSGQNVRPSKRVISDVYVQVRNSNIKTNSFFFQLQYELVIKDLQEEGKIVLTGARMVKLRS